MAITRINQTGFESGSIYEFNIIPSSSGDVYATGNAKTGSYVFRRDLQYPDVAGYSFTPTYQSRSGFDFYVIDGFSTSVEIFRFRSATTTDLIDIRFNTANKALYLYVLDSLKDQSIDQLIQQNTHYHIGIDTKIDVASGWVKIYVNGSEVASFSGNTGSTQIGQAILSNTIDPGAGSRTVYFDDFYVDDTTGEGAPTGPPIKRFYPINVNGDGTYSQWTPNTGTSHYQLVDDRPPDNDTTYLEAVTGSLLDSFDMTTFTLENNQDIIAMIPFVFAKRGSTTEQISLGTRSSGTNLIGAAQDLSTSYGYLWERQITGSLGFDWNQSYLDSVEVIINSTGTY